MACLFPMHFCELDYTLSTVLTWHHYHLADIQTFYFSRRNRVSPPLPLPVVRRKRKESLSQIIEHSKQTHADQHGHIVPYDLRHAAQQPNA